MTIVTDAEPLICLADGGQLHPLRVLYDRVVVPRIVFDGVTVAGAGLVGATDVAAADWLEIIDRAADPDLLGALEPGEAAAIPLAAELRAVLVADDGAARAVAAERGIAVVGSLGVLLAAERRGHLDAVRPVLDRMVVLGVFAAPALQAHVLALAGESGTAGGERARAGAASPDAAAAAPPAQRRRDGRDPGAAGAAPR